MVDPNNMLFSLKARSKCQEETLQNMVSGFDINKLFLLTLYFEGFLLGIEILFLVKIACYWDQRVFDFDMFKFHQNNNTNNMEEAQEDQLPPV